MAHRPLPGPPDPEGFDMTPMIDIVFQLVIFFLLVTDMAERRIEPMVLPSASRAIPVKGDPQLLVLNILTDGTVRSDGRLLWSPAMGDNTGRPDDLFGRLRRDPARQTVRGDDGSVKYPLLVRCDRSAPFEHVQKILMIASLHGGVTRLDLGARPEAR